MAFRASTSRLNTQRQQSGSVRDLVEDVGQLAALPVQRRRPLQGRVKRAGSSGKFEKKGHYEVCGTVKLLLAAAQVADVVHLEQAFLAEVGMEDNKSAHHTPFAPKTLNSNCCRDMMLC